MTDILDRLLASRPQFLTTGLLSFGLTLAFVLAQPGATLA